MSKHLSTLVLIVLTVCCGIKWAQAQGMSHPGCGSDTSYRHEDARISNPSLNPALRPYFFSLSHEARAAAKGMRVADLVNAVDTLPGFEQRLSGNAPQVIETADGSDAKRDVAVHCAIAMEARRLFRAASNPAIAAQLETLTAHLTAGRYDVASTLDDVANAFASRMADRVRNEIGLGHELFELVKDRIATIDLTKLSKTDIVIRYPDDGGLFAYSSQTVRLDVRAIRLILGADYLFYRQGSGSLEECLEDGVLNGEMPTFCANLFARASSAHAAAQPSTETVSWTPPKIAARTPGIGVKFTLADAFDSWRSKYGSVLVQAYMDEVWNFMRAAAVAVRSTDGGCVEVRNARINPSTSVDCAKAISSTNPVIGYHSGESRRVLRWFRIALSHEFSHHLLGHSAAKVAEVVKTFPRWVTGEKAEVIECKARLVMETEADVLGVSLLNQSNTPQDIIDYFGTQIALNPGTDLHDAAGNIGRRMFSSWAPFFDGYAGFFEGDLQSCSYFLSKTRHVLFHTLFFLTATK
jgi:hypothetical protein